VFADPSNPSLPLAADFLVRTDARTSPAVPVVSARQAPPLELVCHRHTQQLPMSLLEIIAADLARAPLDVDRSWTEGARRRYTRLLEAELYDAWLIAWLPSSGLDLHDHGGSEGAIAVVRGKLVETYTDSQRRHSVRSRSLQAPNCLGIPASRIHEVTNPGPEEAISVHVYSPPLRSMTFYKVRPGCIPAPLSTSVGNVPVLEEAAL
jgi:hypothetical protein